MANKVIGDALWLQDRIKFDPKVSHNFISCWSSPEAFGRHVAKFRDKDSWHPDNAFKATDPGFYGTKTMDEALDYVTKGWAQGGELLGKVQERVLALNPMLPKAIKYDIAGAVPNVPRAIAGNIFNMKAMDLDKSKRRPVLTIWYNMSENWTVSKDSVTNKAAVMAALIDLMETKGYACEVIAVGTSKTYGNEMTATTMVVVKESSHALDINRLAFALGHSAMWRRLIFCDWEFDDYCRPLGSGLGRTGNLVLDKELDEAGNYVIRGDDPLIRLFANQEIAAKQGVLYLAEQLKKQDCPPFMGDLVGAEEDVQAVQKLMETKRSFNPFADF